jgi:hypothetical protein
VRRLVREPLVHFAALGAVIFLIYAVIHRVPAADRVVVDQALALHLADSFRRAWLREPTRDELAEMVLDHINDEVLYREALARHLDRDDPAVRRRLIEKLTVSEQPHLPAADPDDAQLRAWFDDHRHHFHEPARFTFQQVFFDPRTRGPSINEAARAALTSEAPVGDPSSLPPRVEAMPEVQVGHLFGKGFVDSLSQLPLERWSGPLSSTQGLHLVRLQARQPPRDPAFDEVRAAVRADWITARSKGYLQAAAGLRSRYRIEVDPAVRQRLQGAPLLAPVLK